MGALYLLQFNGIVGRDGKMIIAKDSEAARKPTNKTAQTFYELLQYPLLVHRPIISATNFWKTITDPFRFVAAYAARRNVKRNHFSQVPTKTTGIGP